MIKFEASVSDKECYFELKFFRIQALMIYSLSS